VSGGGVRALFYGLGTLRASIAAQGPERQLAVCVGVSGGAIGLAFFGVVLSTVLAAELRAGLTPLVAQLPPSVRQQVNLDQIGAGRIGNPGSQLNLPAELRPAARAVVRNAFAAAVTRIYGYAAALMLASFLVLVALPETPLLSSQGPPAPPPPPA